MATRNSKPKTRATRAARALQKANPALTYQQALRLVRTRAATGPVERPRPPVTLDSGAPVTWMTDSLGGNMLAGPEVDEADRVSLEQFAAFGFGVAVFDDVRGLLPSGTSDAEWYPLTVEEARYLTPDTLTGVHELFETGSSGFTRSVDGAPVKVLTAAAELLYCPDGEADDDEETFGGRADVLAMAQSEAARYEGILATVGGYASVHVDIDTGRGWPAHFVDVVVPLASVMAAYPSGEAWWAEFTAAGEPAGPVGGEAADDGRGEAAPGEGDVATLVALAKTFGLGSVDLLEMVDRVADEFAAQDYDGSLILCAVCGEPLDLNADGTVAVHHRPQPAEGATAEQESPATDHDPVAEANADAWDRILDASQQAAAVVNAGGLPAQVDYLLQLVGSRETAGLLVDAARAREASRRG